MKFFQASFLMLLLFGCGGGSGSSTGSNEERIFKKKKAFASKKFPEDQFSKHQWHLKEYIKDIWDEYAGLGVIVQVVDDGVDAKHEDLEGNVNLQSSYNVNNKQHNPTPSNLKENTHGTQVAGVIGAVGYNTIGIKGIAPYADIAGFAFPSNGESISISNTYLQKAWLTGENANNIAISNNSWGSCVSKDLGLEKYLKEGTHSLRDGKGRIYVFSAGNRRGSEFCSSNTFYLANSQYSIAIAAVNSEDKKASYSQEGANILVSGYSGGGQKISIEPGVVTTVPRGASVTSFRLGGEEIRPLTFDDDEKRSYTYSFSGTSAAAPMVSGSLALVLEACPNLTYRDVKWLIAKTATKVNPIDPSWVTNKAKFHHSNKYGFGLINPKKMIEECTDAEYNHLHPIKTTKISIPVIISDIQSSIEIFKEISKNLIIEWVGLTVTAEVDNVNQLEIKLTSPNDTQSILFNNNYSDSHKGRLKELLKDGFRFSSQAFMGEKSSGTWKVNIVGENRLSALNLEIVGH